MIIAQITDPHIRPKGTLAYGRANTSQMMLDCFETLKALRPKPDVVLLSGDLTDCGLIGEYRLLAGLLEQLDMPVFVIPGNHDNRENLLKVFGAQPCLANRSGDMLYYVIDQYPVRLIALDTLVPGQGYGELGQDQLEWLGAVLEDEADKPTVIFMHHPPFPTGIVHMDRINCRDGGEMAKIIARHANVERVLAGHHHRPIHIRWAGTIGTVVPAIAHQVLLDLEEGTHPNAMIKMEPPAFGLHIWSAETGVISHQVYIGSYPGPFAFEFDPDYPAYNATPVCG